MEKSLFSSYNIHKAQTAFEYFGSMVILSIVILYMTSLAYVSFNDSLGIYYVNSALDRLGKAVDDLTQLSSNSFVDVVISLPTGYNSSLSYIGSLNGSKGKSIQIAYKQSTAFKLFSVDVYGRLPSNPGTYMLRVYKTSNDRIRIDTYENLKDLNGVFNDINLISYWNFDNSTNDYTKRFNGTITGNVNCSNTTTGIIQTACNFSGSISYISIPLGIRNYTNPLSNNISISFWYKPSTIESSSWDEVVVGGYTYHWFVSVPSNVPTAFIYNSGATLFNVSSSVQMEVNKWYHVVVIYYTNRSIDIFVNGLKRNSTTWSGGFTEAQNYFRIGGRGSVYINGVIDDLRIYNKSLNKFEVEDLYYMGYQGN
ncbi:MAG: LamG domain-containing protein [Candidatus Micrarchaeota archaeon]|nr:LamG domain-containing protein [Candidatus Micrarchaeota archaeon]